MQQFHQLSNLKLFKIINKMQQPLNNPADMKFDNVTKQQLKKIEKSMKKPEFMGLLNEYMIQISDPKNRQQYDQYLRQMQQQGELPKHMKLVELNPEFCIRTQIVSQKNKTHQMKFFINFCSTQALQQPLCQPTQNNGKLSFGWKIPNSMGKIRYDQDKNGNPCQVADAAFHSQCFKIIEGQSKMPVNKNEFKSMIISIGLQSAQKQLGQRKQTLSKDYDILKNLKCKGGKPALLPMRFIKGKAFNKGEGAQQQIQRDTEGKQTKLQKQLNQKKQEYIQQKQKGKPKSKEEDEEMEQQLQQNKKLVQDLDLEEGIQQPKYASIYTYPIDYSQYMQDPSYMKASKTPSHFTVQFKLPRVQSMEQINGDSLNVNQNRIILKIGQKYFIDLPFDTFKIKYTLLTQKIKAKFDKKKKTLKVTIAIDMSIKYHTDQPQQKGLVSQIQNNEDKNNQNNQRDGIIENQTWKNKVLEFGQTNVDLKILDNNQELVEQKQEQKKLIQQIDEDDVQEQEQIKQNKKDHQKNDKQSSNEEYIANRGQAFSLSKYRQKFLKPKQQQIQSDKTTVQPNILKYIFQQTSDKIVLVIRMQNYKKQDIKVVQNQQTKDEYFIVWNRNALNVYVDVDGDNSAEQDLSKIDILHVKVKQQFLMQIKKSEVVLRVGFMAVFIHKQNKNKFWESTSVQTIDHRQKQGELQTTMYSCFKAAMNQLQTKNQNLRIKIIEEKQKQKQIQNIKTKENQNKNVQQKNKIKESSLQQRKAEIKNIPQENETVQSSTNNNMDQMQQQNQGINPNNRDRVIPNFMANGPQFIMFETNLIQALD